MGQENEAARQPCLVYSRVVGYFAPTINFNDAKKSEYEDRKTFKVKTD